MTTFSPLRYVDGYLPIEDHGLIGDGTTAALVSRDGAITWLCVPRFDSPPLFCGILDATQGGSFRVAPDGLTESRQFYEPDTGVLVTELRSPSALVRITDALTLSLGADLSEDAPAGRTELLRQVEVLHGRTRLRINVAPHKGARVEGRAGGLLLRYPSRPELDLQLFSTVPLQGLGTIHELDPGERLHLVLRWGGGAYSHTQVSPNDLLRGTVDAWRRWMRGFRLSGPTGATGPPLRHHPQDAGLL
jgi:alpha,alpha-trehalase